MSRTTAAVLALLEGPLADASFELVDVDCAGIGTAAAAVRIFVELAQDHPVGGRIDLDGVASATRIVDEILDADEDVIPGRYTLEVSSPGLERPLRTPAHFRRAIGSTITVKTVPGTPGERRIEGRLDDASVEADGGIRVSGRTVAYAEIDKSRLVVNWGPPPKPGKDVKAERTPHPKAVAAAAALAAASSAAGIESPDDDEDDEDEDENEDLEDEDENEDLDVCDDSDGLKHDEEHDHAEPGTDEHEGDDV